MWRKMANNEINADCKCNFRDAHSPVTPQRTDNTIWLLSKMSNVPARNSYVNCQGKLYTKSPKLIFKI